MCGIVGQVRGDARPVEPELLARMAAALEHRGPDSNGFHREGPAGIGIQRLRVIDLESGDQPIYNEDRTIAVVLNGEIYNYAELRDGLRRRGHRLATRGDTEVIAHLYEEEGPACVHRLAGMFAFALWDAKRGRLLLARDRLGKKPLFYSLRGGQLSFASELVALLEDGEIPRDLDPQAIDAYLTFGYVPDPMSAFAHVRKLPPASTLVLEGGRAGIERYWRLRYDHKTELDPVEEGEVLRDAILAATRRRLVADVPLGAFLSGGIDSSAVVAAMSQLASGTVKTFSIGFEDQAFDELPHARTIARRFDTDHHELVVRPDAVSVLPKLVRHYGEPYADHSAIPSFYLAEMARRHVTVALNGDGGDESFAGYGRYLTALRLGRLDAVPGPVRALAAATGRRVAGDGHLESARNRARRVAAMLPLHPADRYLLAVSRFGWAQRDLYTPEFSARLNDDATAAVIRGPWHASSAGPLVDRMLDVDLGTHLAGDLLVKMDIATMAFGLEARSPLLDHELMQLAASLPAGRKAANGEKKIALRAALRPWLPDEILDRPKRGFQVPMARWLRAELGALARETLLAPDAAVGAYVPPARVRSLLDRHEAGLADNSTLLWSLLVLEQWHASVVSAAPSVLPRSAALAA